MTVPLLLEALLAVLLAATVSYCYVLNRRLGALRATQAEMQALISEFNRATERAEAGIVLLRRASDEAGAGLQRRIDKAQTLADELGFIVETGDRLADRLTGQISAARRPAAAGTATPVVEPVAVVAASRPDGGAKPRSEAAREFQHALRRVK